MNARARKARRRRARAILRNRSYDHRMIARQRRLGTFWQPMIVLSTDRPWLRIPSEQQLFNMIFLDGI